MSLEKKGRFQIVDLYIDPGVGGTGIYISEKYSDGNGICVNLKSEGTTWQHKAKSIRDQLRWLIEDLYVFNLYIEFPKFYQTATVVAARGDLVKLAVLTGMIIECCRAKKEIYIEPQKWKGQLSKEMVRERVSKYWHFPVNTPDHVIDAYGIACYVRGQL